MSTRSRTVDVSELPTFAFGHHGLIWWGTIGFMVIEASMFLIVFVVYFYLRLRVEQWPPSVPFPNPFWATVNLLVLLASCLPNQLAKLAAEKFDLPRVRLWLTLMVVFGLASIVLRAFEYPALNVRWNTNAYGSIVWVLLSMHTLHLVTDVVDSMVLLAVAFLRPVTGPRFVDLSENALYWYFIVGSWIPVYLILYFAPRWL